MNIQKLMQLSKRKDEFVDNHPMVPRFLQKIKKEGLEENDIIEIMVKKTNGEEYTANIKVKNSDLILFNEIMELRN